MAVCSFCRSTLVRDGETLRRIGRSAELFDDHSPLALGARGQYKGEPFTLIGRLQLAYADPSGAEGRWTEWHALFDNGRSGSLSEDNGAYVFGFALPSPPGGLPDVMGGPLGGTVIIAQQPWVLASRVQAHVHAMEGEQARMPDMVAAFPVVELRNTAGEVLSIEPQALPPALDVGQSVQLADLKLSGIADAKEASQGKVKAKGIECPSCGAALEPKLESTQSIVCGSCKAVVDISKGLGANLAYFRQDNTLEPLIKLGTIGRLKVDGEVLAWQVVGYQDRCEVPTDPDDEQVFWREYLLYNRNKGFAFLVDAQDGWSLVRPVTGVPALKGDGALYQGARYQKRFAYAAKTTYVLGEFYWPVSQDQRSFNTDYVGVGAQSHLMLNREETGNEVTWSAGEALSAKEVTTAFRLPVEAAAAFKRDVSALSGGANRWVLYFFVLLAVLLLIAMMSRCSSDDCSQVRNTYGEASTEYQQCRDSMRSSSHYSGGSSGGSYGGYSSGGFHK